MLVVPYAISSVATQMLALEQGGEMVPHLVRRTRLRTASGQWLVLHASRLSSSSTQRQIAMIIKVARPAAVAPLIVEAYDLSRAAHRSRSPSGRQWLVHLLIHFFVATSVRNDWLLLAFQGANL